MRLLTTFLINGFSLLMGVILHFEWVKFQDIHWFTPVVLIMWILAVLRIHEITKRMDK